MYLYIPMYIAMCGYVEQQSSPRGEKAPEMFAKLKLQRQLPRRFRQLPLSFHSPFSVSVSDSVSVTQ